jgi:hypothetical protein
MSLENDLRDAMRRVPAPEGFAERLLARVKEPRREARPQWWRAAAAALLLASILGGWGVREAVERRREGERAREQVLLALRITGAKVAHAQHEVRDHMAR